MTVVIAQELKSGIALQSITSQMILASRTYAISRTSRRVLCILLALFIVSIPVCDSLSFSFQFLTLIKMEFFSSVFKRQRESSSFSLLLNVDWQ